MILQGPGQHIGLKHRTLLFSVYLTEYATFELKYHGLPWEGLKNNLLGSKYLQNYPPHNIVGWHINLRIFWWSGHYSMPLSGYKCDKVSGNQNLDICRLLSAQASDEFLRRGISLLNPSPLLFWVLTQIRSKSNASVLFARVVATWWEVVLPVVIHWKSMQLPRVWS